MDSENNEPVEIKDLNINNETEETNFGKEPLETSVIDETVVDNPKKPCKIWKMFLVIMLPLVIAGIVMAIFWALNGGILGSSKQINLDTTKATEAGQKYLVEANNKFAFDLYAELDKEDNVFYSPYSISSAMAMVYEGAGGQTADEIKSALYFPDLAVLRNNFGIIYKRINDDNKNYELATGNALWIDKELAIKQSYLDAVKNSYAGKASNVDFANNAKEAAELINKYISEQTREKIPELLEEGKIKSLTKLIITNAIYFKSDWREPFSPDNTLKDAKFFKTDDQIIKTNMMYLYDVEGFKYIEDNDLKILEIPYKGDDLSMLIILPKKDLNSISKLLKADRLEKYRKDMTKRDIETIALPKFKIDTKYELNDNLMNLGIKKAFGAKADFSKIAVDEFDDSLLYISDVIHKAYIDVTEEGTEAAAATAVIMDKITSIIEDKPKGIKFIANRPFAFIIQENKSGNILFMGKISHPAEK